MQEVMVESVERAHFLKENENRAFQKNETGPQGKGQKQRGEPGRNNKGSFGVLSQIPKEGMHFQKEAAGMESSAAY